MVGFSEYEQFDAVGLAGLVANGEVHPRELVEAAIERIDARNPQVNAVVDKWYDSARREADGELPAGPFRGVPLLLKDLLAHVEGRKMTSACRFHADYVSGADAELVRRMRQAGTIFMGRTNCPEIGILGHSAPLLHGICRNPWNLDHTPGGSSGGAGAAVAAGMVPIAAGGDGGGSIRIPASACGVFGLKPTRARTPMGPQLGEDWNGWVVQHVITRSVRDSAAMLDATQGPERGMPYHAPPPSGPYLDALKAAPRKLRIGFYRGSLFGRELHADCGAAVDDAVKLCEELGHELVEALPDFDREALVHIYFVVVCANVATIVDEMAEAIGRKPQAGMFEPTTWLLKTIGTRLTSAELNGALRRMQREAHRVAAFFDDHDLFLCSTLARPPMRHDELELSGKDQMSLKLLRALPLRPLLLKALNELGGNALEAVPNTQLFNQTGQPAMSVPLYWNERGLPIGVQFAGRFGDEATLFQLASQLEQARPWASRRPPLG